MKNLLTAFLPALALLALGGCASTSGLATSEDDGVYYSSKDRTTAIVSAAPAASTDEAANPDYNGNTASAPAPQANGSDEYYDNTYTYMRGVPNYGVTYYTPYSPYTSINYAWGAGACGFSPYGICDPFYSPFYSPFGYGYGSGVSVSFGFGRPWGYGGYGRGFYGYGQPYGYGYGGGFYDPFYYSSPFYGGYYGRGGYYGNNFGGNYGYSNRYNNNRYYGNDNVRARTSGHRNSRVADGRYSSGNATGAGNAPAAAPGNGRVRADDRMMPGTPTTATPTAAPAGEQLRTETITANQPGDAPVRTEGYNQPRRQQRTTDRPVYRDMSEPTNGTRVTRDQGGRRLRNIENTAPEGSQPQPVAVPEEQRIRRGGFIQNAEPQPSNATAPAEQPVRQQRTYEQPRQQRTYEQPRQQTYEQPRQQTYEQPQRSSQPSYSAPSNGGGNNSGGGRSRGRAD